MKVSMWRASFAGKYSSTLKPLTSPANWQAKLDASKRVIGAMPVRPATRLAQPSSTVLPTGLIRPRPVTTTRRRLMFAKKRLRRSGGLLVLDRVIDRELHRRDLLGLFVGNLDAEFVFECHHQ